MDDATAIGLFFKAFCNKCRFVILKNLLAKSLSVNEMAGITGLEQSHVSHHLRELLKSGLIDVDVKGHMHKYRIGAGMRTLVKEIIKHFKKYQARLGR